MEPFQPLSTDQQRLGSTSFHVVGSAALFSSRFLNHRPTTWFLSLLTVFFFFPRKTQLKRYLFRAEKREDAGFLLVCWPEDKRVLDTSL